MPTAPLTLALETSSRMGSIALGQDGSVLTSKAFSAPLRHSSEILPTIHKELKAISYNPLDIKQVSLSIGPGSFTGLRIAVTLAKTLALTNQCSIIPVSSLDVVVANINSPLQDFPHLIAPIVDAKRGQFFTALYHQDPEPDSKLTKIVPDCLLSAAEILQLRESHNLPLYLLGDGLTYHSGLFDSPHVELVASSLWGPQAKHVYHLGEQRKRDHSEACYVDALTLSPAYLREALVTPKKR